MRIGIISLVEPDWKPIKIEKRADNVLKIVNDYNDADLLLFSGSTINHGNLKKLIKSNNNIKSTIILEAEQTKLDTKSKKRAVGNSEWYFIKGNKIIKDKIKQLFATSSQAKHDLLKSYLEQLENQRSINIRGHSCRLVICGENNMLLNRQSANNRVSFRSKDLQQNFKRILSNTAVFLNPAHTPMGNLGKMRKRWSYLSRGGRLCLFTTNAKDATKLHQRRLQYVFSDGKELTTDTAIYDDYRVTFINWERKG